MDEASVLGGRAIGWPDDEIDTLNAARIAGNVADFHPDTEAVGNLVALCCDCETIMYKRISKAKLPLITAQIEVMFTEALSRIGDSNKPTVNSDFK
jgi:hypothetical protein